MSDREATIWIDYDYAVVRLVPHVHSATFMNIGVLVHARSENYLGIDFRIDRERIAAFAPGVDIGLLEGSLAAFRAVAAGGAEGGTLGMLPPSERFGWLTSPRSAVVQTSPVHPGRCRDLEVALARLLEEHCSG